MAAELIGRCKCPLCGSEKARLTLARSRLSVLTCNGCNFQAFARSDRSDELLRQRIVAEPAPAAAPAEPVRTAPATPATPPAPVRTEKPAEPVRTAAPSSAFNFMGWME